MRQHTRQFILVAHGREQSTVNGHETAGDREGVDRWLTDDEVIELVLTFFRLARETMANFLDILLDFGVSQDDAFLAYLVYVGQAGVKFFVNGNRRVGGTAQFRQILIGPFGGLRDALRVTHAHARAERGGDQKCGYGFKR